MLMVGDKAVPGHNLARLSFSFWNNFEAKTLFLYFCPHYIKCYDFLPMVVWFIIE